ncbi:sigma-70 family RNA polymerase sigma factor [Pigmentiphaga litoralis]|uniref:sigma-70 family RNA polymerase sigma factor n=1 Tax=Pigmentiphaga litoralis TaxID=516702 RepID=UPI003B43957C
MHLASPTEVVTELYSAHLGWLQGWLRKKLGCAHKSADLAQDTFIRILIAFERQRIADAELREPRAYLTTVATRLVSNHFRRQALERAYAEALSQMPAAAAPPPEQRLMILEALDDISAMLDALPDQVRAVFLAAQLDGLTYSDIALKLGISPRTVRRYMAVAYERCLLHQS